MKQVVGVQVADGRQRDGQLAVGATQVLVFLVAVGNDLGPEATKNWFFVVLRSGRHRQLNLNLLSTKRVRSQYYLQTNQ